MNLLSIQAQFQQHVLGGADATSLLAGSSSRRALGLAIYANAYRSRLVAALADAYTKTQQLLGADAFEAAAASYIAGHTPGAANLRWYGADYDTHLAAALPEQPMAAEMARLDWALRSAFDGPDAPVLVAAQLAELPAEAWADLTLLPVPTTQLLDFQHNTVAVWQALNDDAPAPAPQPAGTAVTWVVWRKELQPHFRSLHPLEAELLAAMLAGVSFAQACEHMSSTAHDSDADFVGSRLRQWLDDQLLCGVQLAGEGLG